jgi:gliding motility-associated-like protein
MAQQQILLLTETFENNTNVINTTAGGVGSNTGSNQWIVNNSYIGQPTYPNTPPQDSIVSGTINGAPNSKYLHIYDATGPVNNANWNPANASDRFAFINRSFCTLGMTNVIFTFFWICEGNSNAYGEVYYRNNGGPWTKTGQTLYNNQSKWKYEVIQDPAFNNAENLEVGFRWVNPAAGGTPNVSFGIDDIIAVGTYDSQNNPVHLSISLISPLTVCQDQFLTIGYKLSAPLCDGTYRIQMSNANGSFANPVDGGVFSISAPDTTGFIGFKVPSNVTGNCFRIRINRISPEPLIIGDTSICFSIIDCPESIVTNNAPVMTDVDTACILSVIDVKFNSFGVFNVGNIYRAELSDSNGSFLFPYLLGTLPTNEAYPAMPGNVSGLIPQNVPPGCGYYIRIRSSSPSVVGTTIGPFCLTRCDELTNNHTDIHFCIASGPYPSCSTIVIHPNQWNNQASYDTCNQWTVELRSMMNFGLVNSGGLGVYKDNIGGNFVLCVPSTADSLPVAPGTYYMRIVSNCSNQTWNQTGTVIRITIGAPQVNAPQIITVDTVYCNLGLVELYVSPFLHPPSDYEWASSGLNNGNAFVWPYNPLLVDFTGAPLNDYIFYVREINFGCYGPYSSSKKITIIGIPNVSISGPTQVCLGDTVTYNVGYLKETYYNWDAPAGVSILDEANSQTTVVFDSIGTFTLSNFTLNDCGGDSGSYTVKVVSPYTVNAGADQAACEKAEVTLTVTSNDIDKVFTTQDTATQGRQGAMFNIIAHADVIIDSFAVKFLSTQPVQAEIYGKPGTYRTFEQSQFSWNQLGAYFNFPPSPLGQMTVIPIDVNQPIAAGDTFGFYITTANTPAINMAYSPGNGIQQGTVYKTDGIIDFVQGTANNYPFGSFIGPRVLNCRIYYSTKAGLHYLWNTGDTATTIQVSPTQTTTYSVIVYDTSGCQNRDSVLITIYPAPQVNAGPDTLICKGLDYVFPSTSNTTNIQWEPQVGLNSYTLVSPTFNYQDSVEYVMTATDNNGCSNRDTVMLRVKGPSLNAGNDTTICPDVAFVLEATASAGNIHWSPPTGLSATTVVAPTFSWNESVEYLVSLTDTFGCVAYDTLRITVDVCESYIQVPQAFSPNADGVNDHFTLFEKNISQYEIRIYNRWGELVYNSRDLSELNDLSKGWDGTYKGQPQNTGTFVYYLTATDIAGKKFEKKGNLTLIR